MKRKFIILIFLISLFAGCKLSDKKPEATKAYSPKLMESLFEKGQQNTEIDTLLKRHTIFQNRIILYWDLFFPEYTGITEASGFYIPENDKADWVEELLMQIEEERIAEELKQMEEELKELSETALPDEPEEELKEEAVQETEPEAKKIETPKADEITRFLEKQTDGDIFMDSSEELKFYEFENEIFVRQKTPDRMIIINSTGVSVTRYFYDSEMLLTKKETWVIASASNSILDKLEEFEYSKPENKIIGKKQTSGDKIDIIRYTEKGLVDTLERYITYKKHQYVLQKRKCEYDEEGKIISDEVIDYNYRENDYKKLLYSFSKKYTYSYNEDDIPPDFSYYENEVLKMKNKYSKEKGEYTSQVFFEEGMSVKTYYKNDLRVKDVYYSNNNVIREKVYENE